MLDPRCNFGFHSVGSRSDLWACWSVGIREEEEGWSWYSGREIERWYKEGRGEEGREGDGEVSRERVDAERGFAASLRLQLRRVSSRDGVSWMTLTHASLQ